MLMLLATAVDANNVLEIINSPLIKAIMPVIKARTLKMSFCWSVITIPKVEHRFNLI